MRIVNIHERTYAATPDRLGALLDALGSRADRLWPRRDWPPMVLDQGLALGGTGGHGPIRYVVDRYEPGRLAGFRFTRPVSWSGRHWFEICCGEPGRTRLRHVLAMDATGMGLLAWLTVFRPLHDAVIEDALARAGEELGLEAVPQRWSFYVRVLRRALRPRRANRPPGA